MNYSVLPPFLFTFLLLCHFQKPLVSVLLSPASPPTLLEADGIFKQLSKMHASPLHTLLLLLHFFPSPLLFLRLLNFFLFCFLWCQLYPPPAHTHTHWNFEQKGESRTHSCMGWGACYASCCPLTSSPFLEKKKKSLFTQGRFAEHVHCFSATPCFVTIFTPENCPITVFHCVSLSSSTGIFES